MPMVKLHNDNFLPFAQEFQGDMIKIDAKRFILMDEEKAIQFRGTYYPIVRDSGGQQIPSSFKMLRIEKIEQSDIPKIEKFRCQACSFYGENKVELDTHINSKHLNQLVDEDEFKKRAVKNV